MAKDIFITEAKRQKLQEELDRLKHVVRGEISDRVQTARAHGDLSENAEYHTAREAQAKNEGRISEIEHILKYGKKVERSGKQGAELGATIVLEKEESGEKKTYTLVDPEEADMAEGKLSVDSPLGMCVLGKETGASCTVKTPRGEVAYKIVSVE